MAGAVTKSGTERRREPGGVVNFLAGVFEGVVDSTKSCRDTSSRETSGGQGLSGAFIELVGSTKSAVRPPGRRIGKIESLTGVSIMIEQVWAGSMVFIGVVGAAREEVD